MLHKIWHSSVDSPYILCRSPHTFTACVQIYISDLDHPKKHQVIVCLWCVTQHPINRPFRNDAPIRMMHHIWMLYVPYFSKRFPNNNQHPTWFTAFDLIKKTDWLSAEQRAILYQDSFSAPITGAFPRLGKTQRGSHHGWLASTVGAKASQTRYLFCIMWHLSRRLP